MPIDLLSPLSFKQPLEVSPAENFVDLFGRLRVSSPETQVQIKQETSTMRNLTLSHGSVVADASLTGTAIDNYFDIVSTGTSGFYRARSKICGLYQNGKSLLVFFTFNFVTTGTTGVTKRVGYFNGEDGIWLEQNGNTVSWKLSSSVDNTVRTVTQENWLGDITLDWTKSQIGVIAFEYLGVGDVICGFVQDRTLLLANVFSNKNELNVPYMATPNLFLTYEMEVDRATTNTETFRAICASCLIEGGQERRGFPFSLSRFTGFNLSANTPTAVFVFRNNSPSSRILITDYQVAFGANATIRVELVRLTTVANLPASGGVINGVEQWLPTAGTVTFTGTTLTSTLATQATRQGSSNLLINQYLETNFDDTGVYYAIVITSAVNNLGLQACLINLVLES
jgi:hypothetical protein